MRKPEINREYIDNNVTVIIRSVGERTTGMCHELIKRQVAERNIHIVSETPFTKAVLKTFEVGMLENRRWTFVVDADVLIRTGVIEKLVVYAETVDGNVFEIEGKTLDKFLFSMNPREAGNHLYRTCYMDKALQCIPKPHEAIRPETYVKDAMKDRGFPWVVIEMLIGLHDYEQYYRDIYRKCFIQAKKHREYVIDLLPRWEKLAVYDPDFRVAHAGVKDGLKWEEDVSIDKNSSFASQFDGVVRELNLEEKSRDVVFDKLGGYLMSAEEYLDYKSTRKANVVVYTAIAGGIDELIQHKYICRDFDYVCFIDTPVENPGIWEIRPMEEKGPDNLLKAKHYKVFPDKQFPCYDYSVWLDGNVDIVGPGLEERIYELIEEKSLMSASEHFERRCSYEEANACMKLAVDKPEIIMSQIAFLRNEGFPENYGLFEMNIIYRRHRDDRIVQLMRDWWRMITTFSSRDQLSIMYVLYKNRITCEKLFPENARFRNDILFYSHNRIIYTAVQIDGGNGFNNRDMIIQRVALPPGGRFEVFYDMKKHSTIKSLRFIPAIGQFCRCIVSSVETDGVYEGIGWSNSSSRVDGRHDFITPDPIFILQGDFSNATWIKIKGSVAVLTGWDIAQRFIALSQHIDALTQRIEEKNMSYNGIYNSDLWKFANKVKHLAEKTGLIYPLIMFLRLYKRIKGQ